MCTQITEEHVNSQKAVGTTGNTLCCNGLKFLSRETHKVLDVQARLRFASEHLNESEKAWKKVLWSDEPKIKIFGINLSHYGTERLRCTERPMDWAMNLYEKVFPSVTKLKMRLPATKWWLKKKHIKVTK
uniref:Transposase Tc1-like domain-containing protein n=1 Tax=Oreochromis niloticus TaxID=8128 RepID=A0A669EPM8_ORENI